jgi:hypothetical protein
MADFCTCGTELVPGSSFCHRCGKPQRDIPEYRPEPETVEVPVAPVPVVQAAPTQASPPPVNFSNRLAIQIGLVMAILATLASFLVYVNWLAAGFFTVMIYRRRTGYSLDVQSGVRLGWITGILMFVIMTVILTGAVLFVSNGGLANLPAEVKAALDPRMQEALKSLQNGPAVAEMIVMLFVFTTMLSMAGAALGAKLLSRPR